MCLACLQTLRRQITGKVYFKPSNTISTFNWKPRRDSAQRSQVKLTQCNLKLNSFLIITRWPVCVQIWLGSISNLRNTFDLSIRINHRTFRSLPFLWISVSLQSILFHSLFCSLIIFASHNELVNEHWILQKWTSCLC